MADVTPRTINRRPFAFWAACATLLIVLSTMTAMVIATYLAERI